MTTYSAAELLQRHGIEYVATTKAGYTTNCPQCAGGYLNVRIDRDGVAWYCHHCESGGCEKFEQADASELGPIKACYDYTDEHGHLLYQVLRFEPARGVKQFRQRRSPDQKKWSIKGVRIVPFRLPRIIAAIERGETVFIVEGEKDVLTLENAGVAATCNPMGAGKWRAQFNETFRAADVVVIGDNDAPGRAHARKVARELHGIAKSVRLIDIAEIWPQAEPGDDVTDWLNGPGSVGQLLNRRQQREAAANGEDYVDRGEGAALLNEVYQFLSRFVVYPSEHAQVAHVLWLAHAHLMGAWESTPRIAFLSPEPGSGKTRSMEVSEILVPSPVAAVNVTPAYLFRKVGSEDGPPTILFDEIDTVFGPKAKENEELRALLNSGHRRGAVAGSCVVRGKIVETEEISSYAAVALAGLGWLPDTILSRSIIIRMRRRAPDEVIEPFRSRVHAPEGKALCRRLTGWAATILDEATEARPPMPSGVEDRNADMWEPLLAVADIAGGTWPARARVAAVALVAAAREIEPSLNIRLLADLRTVFDMFTDAEALPTKQILAELCALEDAPWNDLKGKPLSDAQLARRLRQYEIRSKVIRIGTATPRGYMRADLHDAWRRYLPSLSDKPATAATPATWQTFQGDGVASDDFDPATGDPEPQHPDVAPHCEACCASAERGNADEMGDVAPVAPVAPVAAFRRNGGDHCAQCGAPGDAASPLLVCGDAGLTVLLHPHCIDAWLRRWDGPDLMEADGGPTVVP